MGWCTSVITADPYGYERYDANLLGLVPNETEIVRVQGRDPWQAIQSWRTQRMREKCSATSAETAEEIRAAHHEPLRSRIREAVRAIEAWYYHPDMARPWIRPAVEAAVSLCKHKRPDVLWATAGPLSAWIVAREASQRTGVPYILDLRDPHGLSYYESEKRWPAWVKHRVYGIMHQALKNARATVFLFESVAECYLHAFPGALDPKKIHIIPNGYDGPIERTAPAKADRCTVLYTGTISTYRYDSLLQSLVLLRDKHPDEAKRLRLHFVGEGTDALAKDAAVLGLSKLVETSVPVPQNQIARLQCEAHALLLLGRPPTMTGYELVAGAKLFEYLKARRPILGVLPEDEGKKILFRLGAITVADVDSPFEILTVLRRLIDAWSSGLLSALLPDRAAVDAYSAASQTAALVRALEGMPAVEPFVPGSAEVPPSLRGQMIHNPITAPGFNWI